MKYTGVGGAVCACLSRKLGVRRTHEVWSESIVLSQRSEFNQGGLRTSGSLQ